MSKIGRAFECVLLIFFILSISSCKEDDSTDSRTYYMGFQNSAPTFDDLNLYLQSLNIWTLRADAAMITTEVPWKKLFDGATVNEIVVSEYKELVNFYRSKNLKVWVYIDPQNGLDRASDALELIDAGKSIADPDMQLLFQKFTIAMDSILNPDHLGLALETNLIRDISSPAIYEGVKNAAINTAAIIKLKDPTVPLSVSVQVDHAWGKFTNGVYKGIAQDLIDFPFVEELGLSSYPYFGFNKPSDIPLEYYSKLVEGKDLSVFVSEGGWTSLSVNSSVAPRSPEIQKDYIQHQGKLLEKADATAVFQLLFTDLDEDKLPADLPANLPLFAYLGLVDKNLEAKPALAAWDELFKNHIRISK